jgi:hypothetical protein
MGKNHIRYGNYGGIGCHPVAGSLHRAVLQIPDLRPLLSFHTLVTITKALQQSLEEVHKSRQARFCPRVPLNRCFKLPVSPRLAYQHSLYSVSSGSMRFSEDTEKGGLCSLLLSPKEVAIFVSSIFLI